jgi:hypothetical protein
LKGKNNTILRQAASLAPELSIRKDLWVHFEATTTMTLDETLRGQEMQRMVRVDVPMHAPAQTPNALTSNVFGAA